MKLPGKGHGGDGWAGSNVDLGTVAEIDAELQHRIRLLDDSLAAAKQAAGELGEARGVYLVAFARSVAASHERTSTGKEREAKTENVHDRVRHERAELVWKLAQLACDVGQSQLTGVQTRAANLRGQMQLDGTAPSFDGRRGREPEIPERRPKAPF